MPMPFWTKFDNYKNAIALIEPETGRKITYRKLSEITDHIAQNLHSREKGLIFLPLRNQADDIVLYLAALRSGHAVFPYGDHHTDQHLESLIQEFQPDKLIGRAADLAPNRYQTATLPDLPHQLAERLEPRQFAVNALLQLVLSTSGSSGKSKLVRLSSDNINHNAAQICSALRMNPTDVGITTLPVIYVYGLSVLHSHLNTGAAVVVQAHSVMSRGFWNAFNGNAVTSLSGIPWTYELLQSIRFEKLIPKSLRRLTTSGDCLNARLGRWLNESVCSKGVDVYSMYGQTEACGRMCVLPPEYFCRKPLSVGMPVPGAAVEIGHGGSIRFNGPNVMLGYATIGADMALGDVNLGTLDTGDIGYRDDEGCLFLSPRQDEKVKIYGIQVDLNQVREMLEEIPIGQVQSIHGSNIIRILHMTKRQDFSAEISLLSRSLNIPKHAILFETMTEKHRTFSGKFRAT